MVETWERRAKDLKRAPVGGSPETSFAATFDGRILLARVVSTLLSSIYHATFMGLCVLTTFIHAALPQFSRHLHFMPWTASFFRERHFERPTSTDAFKYQHAWRSKLRPMALHGDYITDPSSRGVYGNLPSLMPQLFRLLYRQRNKARAADHVGLSAGTRRTRRDRNRRARSVLLNHTDGLEIPITPHRFSLESIIAGARFTTHSSDCGLRVVLARACALFGPLFRSENDDSRLYT